MTIINRKKLITALPLITLLLITLLVMSSYLPVKNHNIDVYNHSDSFIKALSASAFRRDEG
jgi:hypothetical protein